MRINPDRFISQRNPLQRTLVIATCLLTLACGSEKISSDGEVVRTYGPDPQTGSDEPATYTVEGSVCPSALSGTVELIVDGDGQVLEWSHSSPEGELWGQGTELNNHPAAFDSEQDAIDYFCFMPPEEAPQESLGNGN